MNYTIKTIVEFTLESGRKARIEYNPDKVAGREVKLDGQNAKLFIDDRWVNFRDDHFGIYYKPEFMPDEIQDLEDMNILDDYLN